jgi:hypothetical protein
VHKYGYTIKYGNIEMENNIYIKIIIVITYNKCKFEWKQYKSITIYD